MDYMEVAQYFERGIDGTYYMCIHIILLIKRTNFVFLTVLNFKFVISVGFFNAQITLKSHTRV